MTHIKTRLAGFGLALGLLAIPLAAGAQGAGGAEDEPTAHYAMLDMTRLEQVAGRQHLDAATIKFLEDNVWDYQTVASPHGSPEAGQELLDQATIKFLEDNVWDYQALAEPAQVDESDVFPDPSRCNGEGFGDPANQIIAGVRSGLVARYCTGHAYAAGGPDDYEGSTELYDNMYDANVPREAWDLTYWLDQVEPLGVDPDIVRDPGRDPLRVGVYGIDMGFYSNEIPWQDYVEPVGIFAGVDVSERPVLPFDKPQLRADEPR